MTATVAVVGGGYGGITAAQALDEFADVVLIDPKDSFVHNVSALRTIVDPTWTDGMFLPYRGLLKRGQVVQDLAVSVDSRGVWLAAGGYIAADYIVIATGTSYPFPAKVGFQNAGTAKKRIRDTSQALSRAGHVLLLGAGPVGLELAGEISSAWPHKPITIVDPAPVILSGAFMPEFDPEQCEKMSDLLLRGLAERNIRLLLGTSLWHSLTVSSGTLESFTAELRSGETVSADFWFRCHGRQPASRILSRELARVRRFDDRIEVTPDLRLRDQQRVFAIGDVAASAAMDTAVVAIEQGELAAKNIRALMDGHGELEEYEPAQPFLSVPLGPVGGATYIPGTGVLDGDATADIKGADLLVGKYNEIFGLSN